MQTSICLIPISGDPIHQGHINIIERTASMFGSVFVGLGASEDKVATLNIADRLTLAVHALKHLPNVRVRSYTGLTVDFAKTIGAKTIVRGLRNAKDYEAESALYKVNAFLAPDIQTIFLPTDPAYADLSSTTLKQRVKLHLDITPRAPLAVKEALEAKVNKQYILGVTGEIGVGKSYITAKLRDIHTSTSSIPFYEIDLDEITQEIYHSTCNAMYMEARQKVIRAFGKEIILNPKTETINSKVLAEKVFGSSSAVKTLTTLLTPCTLHGIRAKLSEGPGLYVLNFALIAEVHLNHICNNNVLVVACPAHLQMERLIKRGLDQMQIHKRLASQCTCEEKVSILAKALEQDDHGNIWYFNNDGSASLNYLSDVVLKKVVRERS